MKGTEKQIAWAEKIKVAAMEDLRNTYKTSDEQSNENLKIMVECFANHIDDAKVWIDNRSKYDANDSMWYFQAFCDWASTPEATAECVSAGAKIL